MALNWNIERCDNWNQLIDDDNWGITNALIWTTMIVGLNGITKSNVDEFFARVDTVQKATGELVNRPNEEGNWQPYLMTHADIVRRIGLGTNADTLTKGEFFKHVKKISTLSDNKIKSLYFAALDSVTNQEVNA